MLGSLPSQNHLDVVCWFVGLLLTASFDVIAGVTLRYTQQFSVATRQNCSGFRLESAEALKA